MRVKITEAQMTALHAAGIFEGFDDDAELAAAIEGDTIAASDRTWRLLTDLSNGLDDMARSRSDGDADQRKWAGADSRVLTNLSVKISRALYA